jgi:hypothetical protein
MRPLITIRARLQHLAIVSWAVSPEPLGKMLPKPLVPQLIKGDDGEDYALLSMAMMLDTTMGETYAQMNERAYVMKPDGTGKGAFFWRSRAATWQAMLFRSMLGIPEYAADVRLEASEERFAFFYEGNCVTRLDLVQTPTPHVNNPQFGARALRDAKLLSENPLVGYTLNWGELCETPVTHDTINARQVHIEAADPQGMMPSIAIEPPRTAPIIAVYQRETPFYIGLPPRKVRGRTSSFGEPGVFAR